MERLSVNPHRGAVLSWYRKMLKAAFDVKWTSDDDALYVLSETRRLFRVNAGLRDVESIERKVLEAEQRYHLALHYRIPYPRMFHKAQGSSPFSGVAHASYLDSIYEDGAPSPRTGRIEAGSSNTHFLHGAAGAPSAGLSPFADTNESLIGR